MSSSDTEKELKGLYADMAKIMLRTSGNPSAAKEYKAQAEKFYKSRGVIDPVAGKCSIFQPIISVCGKEHNQEALSEAAALAMFAFDQMGLADDPFWDATVSRAEAALTRHNGREVLREALLDTIEYLDEYRKEKERRKA